MTHLTGKSTGLWVVNFTVGKRHFMLFWDGEARKYFSGNEFVRLPKAFVKAMLMTVWPDLISDMSWYDAKETTDTDGKS